jgi:large subunit ribosomal protein L20
MSRVKGGFTSHRRHKKVLAQTTGHKGQRHRVYRRANESLIHALAYAQRDRRDRKGDFRQLWITRINAAARLNGTTYSRLMHGLRNAGVEIDRKMLADLAVRDPDAFAAIVKRAGAA